MNLTQQRYLQAKQIIPGGTQLLSKKPESFAPNHWPGYYTKAKGCEVWDLDGTHYYDMTTNGIGACLLGFAYEPVVQAVCQRVQNGSMCTQNAPEEVALAEELCRIHPWAEQVRFARGGGEVASVAVRIARATTGRDVVAICGYHGWTDFYIAANLGENTALDGHLLPGLPPAGVPDGLRGTTVTFHYDSIEEFDQVIARANVRLSSMTQGQYTLRRRQESGKAAKAGLNLEVVDHTNASARDVRTLSGGESFMASLALALGLSDEIQSGAGGVKLDTLFVDEGFGSLDGQSLEQAIAVLASLTEGRRLVGIISHVEELGRRIDKKLIVKKDRAGVSRAEIRTE